MDIVKSMYADTIEERYSLIDDDDASGDDSFVDSVISQWMSRNCALRPDDFASMLELRGYDKKKYAKCIDGKSFLKGNKGNLSSWYSDFEKIFAFFSNSKFVEDINVGYVNIFMPFILYAEKTLRTTIPDSQMNSYDNVQNSIRGTLANRLLNIGLKTLVLEMRRENADGNLQGADGHERMLSFIHMASTYAYQRLLYSRYPVLARMLTQATTDYIAFIREMFTRLEESDSELKMFLKSTVPLVLSDIRLDGGDAHNHGRTVAILEFNNGSKVVYKPRDLSIHVLFADLAHECERSDDFLPLHVSRVLPEDGYLKVGDMLERFMDSLGIVRDPTAYNTYGMPFENNEAQGAARHILAALTSHEASKPNGYQEELFRSYKRSYIRRDEQNAEYRYWKKHRMFDCDSLAEYFASLPQVEH